MYKSTSDEANYQFKMIHFLLMALFAIPMTSSDSLSTKANLKYEKFLETTWKMNNPGGNFKEANTIQDKTSLKQQARTSYKAMDAQLGKERAATQAKHGFLSSQNLGAFLFQRTYRQIAEAARVRGPVYQMSKLKSSKPK